MFRFLHSSDLHLGKPFGRFEKDLPGRLREARHDAIDRLAAVARDTGASVVLLAGDTFDAETPAPATVRHALQAMSGAADLTWVMMPGNHDSLAASDLWRRIRADAPKNLILALEPAPVALTPDVMLLPAPCTARRPGQDLTDWMDFETPAGALRVGLAHGAIQTFSEENNAALIPPDRAERSALDYLALGDWHGQISVTPRCWYSGTPEPDSFKHEAQAGALLVTLQNSGAIPDVKPVVTGSFRWKNAEVQVLPGDDIAGMVNAVLPPVAARRNTLLRVSVTGRLGLPDRAALAAAFGRYADDFGWFEAELEALATVHDTADLDQIDHAGALRMAAEALMAEAEDETQPDDTRKAAESALAQLYSYALDVT